jgi:hypothetical protein
VFSITINRPLAAIAVVSGLLVAAAPASAKGMSPKRATGDGTSNTVIFAAVKDADRGQIPTSQVSSVFSGDAYINEMGIMGADEAHTPGADGIIAILIGAIETNDDRRGQDEEKLAESASLTAPLGSTKGSSIDGSVVYGSD